MIAGEAMPDQDHKPTSGVNPGEPTLIRDPNGRTYFYAGGGPSYGYVVPDAWRERALRNAIERFKKMESAFTYVLIVPLGGSILSLGGLHTDLALATLTITFAIAIVGRRLQKRLCFGELIAGLEFAGPRDPQQRRREYVIVTMIGVAYFSLVIWRIMHLVAPTAN
jgi:hypothetical protein